MIVFSVGYWFQRMMRPHVFNIVLLAISIASTISLIVFVDQSMYYGIYFCAGLCSYMFR